VFTVEDFHDFVHILHERPEWREELRRLVLTDEILELPALFRDLAEKVRGLAEAQQRTERRVEELAEAQRRTERRVEELAEAQRRTERRVEELAEAQQRTERRVEELAEAQRNTEKQVQRLTDRVAKLDGRMLESEYQRKAASYFGRLLRNVRAADWDELEDALAGRLSDEQVKDLLSLDLAVYGRLRDAPEGQERPEVWLAVEISVVVDREDVKRAARRADLMRRAGLKTLPVAAGERVTEGAEEEAERQAVILMSDGSMALVEEAMQRHLVMP